MAQHYGYAAARDRGNVEMGSFSRLRGCGVFRNSERNVAAASLRMSDDQW